MEDLAVFTALNRSGSFGKNSVKFQKSKLMLFAGWEVRIVKNCDLGLEKHFQDRGHSFSPYGPPSRKITYISFILFRKIKLFKVLSNLIIVAACIEQFEIWKILYTWNAIVKFPNIFILRKFSLIFDNLKKTVYLVNILIIKIAHYIDNLFLIMPRIVSAFGYVFG